MRILITALLAATVTGALAQPQSPAYSRNAVGSTRVTVPGNGGVNLVGLNFKRISGSQALRASEVFGASGLEAGPAAAVADCLYIWNLGKDGGADYDVVFLHSDGQFRDAVTLALSDPEIPAGAALFLRTKPGSADRDLLLVGEVVFDAVTTLPLPQGLTLIANPYAADLDLNRADMDWSGATAGPVPTLADNVCIWNPAKGAAGGYDVFFLRSSTGKWHRIDAPGTVAADAILQVGQGAFYHARKDFTNDIVRPYPRW